MGQNCAADLNGLQTRCHFFFLFHARLVDLGASHPCFRVSCACVDGSGQEYDGSDSGARPDEAVSWGKIKLDASPVKVGAPSASRRSRLRPLLGFLKNSSRVRPALLFAFSWPKKMRVFLDMKFMFAAIMVRTKPAVLGGISSPVKCFFHLSVFSVPPLRNMPPLPVLKPPSRSFHVAPHPSNRAGCSLGVCGGDAGPSLARGADVRQGFPRAETGIV